MKKYFLSLITLVAFGFSFAQNFEGEVKMDIEYVEIPEAMEMYESMLPKQMTWKIKGEKTRMEQEVMGMTQATIIDNKAKKSVTLMNQMGQKLALTADLSNEDGEEDGETTVEVTKETKEIAGYKCKKALVTSPDGTMLEVWFTEDLPAINNPNASFSTKIKGFPMQYNVNNEAAGMSMTMTVNKVEKKEIADTEFEIPEGYEEMTMEEFQEQMGTMGM